MTSQTVESSIERCPLCDVYYIKGTQHTCVLPIPAQVINLSEYSSTDQKLNQIIDLLTKIYETLNKPRLRK